MICGNCNTVNDAENVFCVNCGNAVAGNVSNAGAGNAQGPTTTPDGQVQPLYGYPLSNSTETAVVNVNQMHAPGPPQPVSGMPYTGETAIKKTNPMIWGIGGLVAVIGLIAVGYFAFGRSSGGNETLPEHLGMYVQAKDKSRVDEVRKQDFSSAIEARNSLSKSDGLSVVDSQPNIVLYADGKDIPINDMRLIQLDTIKDDGSMKQLDFQAAPVDGKPEMKRIRVPDILASGRYAFALFDGFFNDGKHKFWAFQVKDSTKSDNGDALKSTTVSLKPAPPPPQPAPRAPAPIAPVLPAAPPPPGASVATVRARIKLRNAPTQIGNNQIGSLNPGTTVYVLEYSANSEYFNGIYSRYAFVQTPSGQRGWAFAAYLR
jgi:hypothetical protein